MRCGGVVLSIQILQKETDLHEKRHDWRYKHVEMLNQDSDNQDEKSYNLKTHIDMNKNPTYEHDIDTKMERKYTQKYAGNHDKEYDEKDT
jgi:hypothetical protein